MQPRKESISGLYMVRFLMVWCMNLEFCFSCDVRPNSLSAGENHREVAHNPAALCGYSPGNVDDILSGLGDSPQLRLLRGAHHAAFGGTVCGTNFSVCVFA